MHDHTEKHDKHKDHQAHKKHQESGHDHASHDHGGHHAMMIRDFRGRFFVSLALTIPILVLSPMIQELLGYRLDVPGGEYILFALSTTVFFYGGWPFLTGLLSELKEKRPGMMTLIAVAITVAWGYSTATTFGLEGKKFFWELATLIDIMLLGHWIEMKSVMGASRSLEKLVEMMPREAHLIDEDGNTKEVSIEELNKDQVVLIKPGEKIPVDGKIIEGKSQVNESMITGESKPVAKETEDKVIGGTINGNGSLKVKIEETGENAYLSKVIDLVREAQEKKSRSQNLADRIAFWLTIIALTVGIGTLTVWLILGQPFVFALERMASVMVITCPHALGLAVPLVVAISTTLSAQNGLLIRNRTAFENSRKISLLAFDKTGTLTKGEFGVSRIGSLDEDLKDKEILQLAVSLESRSEHPLAAGILERAEKDDVRIKEVNDFNAISGKGVEGTIGGTRYMVAGTGYLKEKNIELPESTKEQEGETIVYMLKEGRIIGFITLADEIRPESDDAVKKLKDQGIKVIMMTGDQESVAKKVSEELGLDDYYAGILPEQKQEKVTEFQEKGEFVAMTGDGVNDAPALATADIGIAVGSGTDVAAETADIILVESNPRDIANLILFGRKTYNKMVQNFIWATGYNVVAIPLAAGVLFSAGILISPAVGALLMSASTVVVAFNAQLLRRHLKK